MKRKVVLIIGLLHCTLISMAQNVGIGINTPSQKLEVAGRIKIADENSPPQKGTIRWSETSQDFEGYNGQEWLSLTMKNSTPWPVAGSGLGALSNFSQHTGPIGSYEFGSSVAIDSNIAVVGAPGETSNSMINGGAAYIYRTTDNGKNWQQIQRIAPPDNPDGTNDKFGFSVAVYGNLIVVGAPYRGPNGEGTVFVYRTGDGGASWQLASTIFSSAVGDNAGFGYDIAIDSNNIVIGAPFQEEPPPNTSPNYNQQDDGAVYAARTTDNGSTWNIQMIFSVFTGDDNSGASSTNLGWSVDISDSIIIASAPTVWIPNRGRVYFIKSINNGISWGYQSYMEGQNNSRYGRSLSLTNDRLLICGSDGFLGYGASNLISFSKKNETGGYTSEASFYNQVAPNTAYSTTHFGSAIDADFYLLNWKDSIPNTCGIVSPTSTCVGKIYKNTGGIFSVYQDIIDPAKAPDDINIHSDISIAANRGLFVVGLPNADVNRITDKGKIIFGRIY